jgi:endoglucanase
MAMLQFLSVVVLCGLPSQVGATDRNISSVFERYVQPTAMSTAARSLQATLTSNSCKTPLECHGALRKAGNRIVDKNGENVKLNGLSLFWSNWAGAFWNGDVVKFLASEWKISLIRCAMGVSNDGGKVDGGYLDDPEGNKAKVSTVVDAAIESGMYVLIDWHVEGRCNADQSKPFFAEMGKKYGRSPNVIWETCNEPHGWAWGDGLKAYHEELIPVIRQYSDNLVVAGTNTWSQDVDDASRDPLSDSNVAYTLHFYSSMHKQPNRDKASIAMSNGAAIFVTEWGVEQNNEGHSETETWLNFLRSNSISNSMWGIYDKDSEPWAIVHSGVSGQGGWSESDLTDTGRFAKAYLLQEAGFGPSPSPPTPAPTPGTKTCSARGGCTCDSSWANPNTCHDDGSCCFACCCSSQLLFRKSIDSIVV